MTFYRRKNTGGEVTATNIPENFDISSYTTKEFNLGDGKIEFITNDLELVKRSKILRKVVETSGPIVISIQDNFINQIKEHSHTLKRLQGQLKQKIEGVVDCKKFPNKNHSEQREIVSNEIKSDVKTIADVLIYLRKRILEIDAHIASFEIIHMGEEIQLDIRPHNIRNIIINILYAFEDESRGTWIKPSFQFTNELAETNKIKLDYKTVNTAFYNFFDNAIKYIKPSSDIRFFLSFQDGEFKLLITMISLRIEQEELAKIFDLRYRGKNAEKVEGLGIGMYVVKKALELNRFSIKVNPDYSHMEHFQGKQYILNQFEISGRV